MKGPERNAEGVTEVEIKNQEPRIKNHEQHQPQEQHKQSYSSYQTHMIPPLHF